MGSHRDFLSYDNVNENQYAPRDFLSENITPKESLAQSVYMAPARIGGDLYKAAGNFIKEIPGYYESAKKEIPGILQTLKKHPGHAALQGLAGTQEGINALAQAPKNIANYATNRLNLLPKNISDFISKITPEDTTQAINSLFDNPQYPGEKLVRGGGRNIFNLAGGLKIAGTLNPLNLTAKNIAKDILKTEKNQIDTHSKAYDKIWDKAEKSGFNGIPIDKSYLNKSLQMMEKYKTPREYESLKNLINNPTLENAQRAQSDMGVIHRALQEKSRKGSLLSEEKRLYDAAKQAEKHIESNMFKNSKGDINFPLQKEYFNLSKSYRKNVVPYKYNPDIQAYKNQEILPNELINALSKGEFAAKRGKYHPAIKLRKSVIPLLATYGGYNALHGLHNEIFGKEPQNYESRE